MLFVASSPARISAFSVSDAPGQEALVATSTLAIPKQEESPLFLSAGPDGQLWMAGSSLRRLQLKLNAQSFAPGLRLRPRSGSARSRCRSWDSICSRRGGSRTPRRSSFRKSTANRWSANGGRFSVPRLLAICRARAETSSPSVKRARSSTSAWPRSTPADSNGQRRQASIRRPERERRCGRRRSRTAHLAVDCAGPKPTVWLIGPGGQLDGSFHTEEPLEAGPVRLAAGLVLPLPGRLRLASATSGLAAGEDYLAPVENKKSARWFAVSGVGTKRSDRRRQPRPTGAASIPGRAGPPPGRSAFAKSRPARWISPLSSSDSRVVYADAGGVLHVLDGEHSIRFSREKLPSPAVNRLWSVGSTVLVETRSHQLLVVRSERLTQTPVSRSPGEHGACRPSGPGARPPALLRIATARCWPSTRPRGPSSARGPCRPAPFGRRDLCRTTRRSSPRSTARSTTSIRSWNNRKTPKTAARKTTRPIDKPP